jgi:hypothetical protein
MHHDCSDMKGWPDHDCCDMKGCPDHDCSDMKGCPDHDCSVNINSIDIVYENYH